MLRETHHAQIHGYRVAMREVRADTARTLARVDQTLARSRDLIARVRAQRLARRLNGHPTGGQGDAGR